MMNELIEYEYEYELFLES